ncbi:MAG: PAS domain-containing protein, partial [Cyanobacteria bacterium]|nr:PAS domain-containing protein [Cyanobacteriota bacterium]MDW8203005.1 PAS domain-containing protein [Cyanobacteriota bacterium SKYGB_h_bin112]
ANKDSSADDERSLVDAVPIPHLACSPLVIYQAHLYPDGSIAFLFVSPRSTTLLDLDADQLCQDAAVLIDRVLPGDRPQFFQSVATASQAGQPWRWVGQIMLSSGQSRWIEAIADPIPQADGSVVWHGAFTDISHHKQTELALRQENRELQATVATQAAELEQAIARMQRQMIDRRQAEAALRASSDRHRALLAALPDMIFRYNRQGVHLEFVPSYDWQPVCSPEAFLNKPVSEILPKPVANQILAAIAQALATGRMQLIEYRLDVQGVPHDYEARLVVSGADEVTAIVRDITDRKQAEAKLRANQKFLELVMNSIPQYVFWKDINSVYLGCNRNFAELAGLASPEDIVGKTDYDLPWRKYAQQFIDRDRKVIATNQPIYRVIDPIISAKGQPAWTETNKVPLQDDEGNVIGILGTRDDVTDRIRAEEALKASEAKLRQKNSELEHLLAELHRTQTQMIQAEKMSSLGQLVAGIAHEINNPVNFIYGNLSYADTYTRDLLELLHAYQRHYPQPPLAIQELADAIDLDFLVEDLPKLLNSMRIGAERIQKIVTSLRTFSRMDESEKKSVNIHDGIDSTLLILQNRMKAKAEHPAIEVVKHYGDLPLVECYAGQLNQVFMNILSNAIDALEEAFCLNDSLPAAKNCCQGVPTITITTELLSLPTSNSRSDSSSSENSQPPTQPFIRIQIADNGLGIPEQARQRLFDPFFTTKPVGKGTGLGLSISYQIITEKHGGRLYCTSEPGKGTTFTIEIPLQLAPVAAQTA